MKPVTTAVLAAALAAPPAWAEQVHLKGKSVPAFVDRGLAIQASAELAGLGEGDLLVTIQAAGNPRVVCVNPAGANQPPGAQPKAVTLNGQTGIPASQVKNGTVAFTVSTPGPVTPIPGAPDCPNRQWTEPTQDIAFTQATVTMSQGGKVVLSLAYTFPAPSADGPIALEPAAPGK